MVRSARFVFLATLLAGLFCGSSAATALDTQEPAPSPDQEAEGHSVGLEGREILRIYEGLGSFSAEQRAEAATERFRKLIYTKDDLSKITVADTTNGTSIMLGDTLLLVVSDDDARHYSVSRQQAAKYFADRIRNTIERSRQEHSPRFLIRASIKALLALGIYLFLCWLVIRGGRWLLKKLQSKATRLKGIRIQQSQIMGGERIAHGLMTVVSLLRVFLLLLLSSILVAVVLNYYPWTRGHGEQMLSYILAPIEAVAYALVSYLPKLFYIAIIVTVMYYVLKFVRLLASEIERGNISIPGFYTEWAQPTYKIVRFLLLAFTAVIIYPYLPGENSPAFKGVGIFIGVLFSLGSTSAVANVVAGVILTYTRGFRVGDWVKIGDNMGEVTSQTMLATHIKTIKNEEIIVPNSVILGSHIINYSLLAQENGLILYTSVTIGYDQPWREIHDLLIQAALKTKNILQKPAPFVLQPALNDSYVQYEINAYTDKPLLMVFTYSDLRANIQDAFFAAGVEIMSPTFYALRDGNRTAMPEEFVRADSPSRAFRIAKDDGAAAASGGKG